MLSLSCAIDAEDLYQVGDLLELAEGSASRGIVAPKKIDIEDVLPRATADGARFDFAQADIARREDAEGVKQRTWDVLESKSYGGLVCAGSDDFSSGNQEKTSEVLFIVLNARFEDSASIDGGGPTAGDGRSAGNLSFNDVLYAACGIVKRHGFDLWISVEKVAALIERDRVGEDAADVTRLSPA